MLSVPLQLVAAASIALPAIGLLAVIRAKVAAWLNSRGDFEDRFDALFIIALLGLVTAGGAVAANAGAFPARTGFAQCFGAALVGLSVFWPEYAKRRGLGLTDALQRFAGMVAGLILLVLSYHTAG